MQTERDVLGNTRVDVVSGEAGAFGVCAGQTVAAARAKCADLRVRVVPHATVHTALARLAEAMLAFGPTTAFDVNRDVVWVEIGGCAHLHGGELELARALVERVHALGHACRVAVADGPRVAAAVARFSVRGQDPRSASEPIVVPEGKGALAVQSLPIAALGLDEDVSSWLADLGLSTCGDLQRLPRQALGMRLGERVHDVMQFLDGRDLAPLEAWRPPEVPEERIEIEWGAHSIEALAFFIKKLCDRLAARLQGRTLAAASLELVLTLDRALLADSHGHSLVLSMLLPSPIARASDLLAIVRARLEGCSLPAPVLGLILRAPVLARIEQRTFNLLEPEPKAHLVLPRLVAELAAELGEGVVGTLALVDTWSPTERTRLVPLERAPPSRREESGGSAPKSLLVTSALEPSRLIHAAPVAHEMAHASLARGQVLARLEAIQWWRQPAQRRDLVAAWLDGAHAWLELPSYRGACPLLRGWID